jgi:hypothetical protein
MKTEVSLYSRWVTQKLTLWLVGTIGGETDPVANTGPDSPLDVAPSTPPFIPSETEQETTNRTVSSELQSPSPPEYPLQGLPPRLRGWGCDAIASSSSDLPSTSIFHDPYDKGRFLDSGGIPRLLPVDPLAPSNHAAGGLADVWKRAYEEGEVAFKSIRDSTPPDNTVRLKRRVRNNVFLSSFDWATDTPPLY